MEQTVKLIQEQFLCPETRLFQDTGATEMRGTADNDVSQIQFRHVSYLVSTCKVRYFFLVSVLMVELGKHLRGLLETISGSPTLFAF